jgi:hypothetical protein
MRAAFSGTSKVWTSVPSVATGLLVDRRGGDDPTVGVVEGGDLHPPTTEIALKRIRPPAFGPGVLTMKCSDQLEPLSEVVHWRWTSTTLLSW